MSTRTGMSTPMPAHTTSTHRLVALISPPQALFELAVAVEIFGRQLPSDPSARYTFEICTLRPGPVLTVGGHELTVTKGLGAMGSANTILVPGWRTDTTSTSPAILNALSDAHASGVRIVGVGTAAFLLAEAGLLSNRRATTDTQFTSILADRYPDVIIDDDAQFVDHGDVATSAGPPAGIELCLHLVRTDHGADYAAKVARHMGMPSSRQDGTSQPDRASLPPSSTVFQPMMDWVSNNLDSPLSVPMLASRAQMSLRHFIRRFTADVGQSPGQWLLSLRIAAACELLKRTDLPIDVIARRVGLSTALNLRRNFRRQLGMTPSEYRRDHQN